MQEFFNSYPGMYMVQSLLHSLIAALVVDRAINGWEIKEPAAKQRFALIVVVLPVFSFPVYQLLNPGRGSIGFRLGALLDSSRWLGLGFWGINFGMVVLFFIFVSSLVFIFQEFIPVLKHEIGFRTGKGIVPPVKEEHEALEGATGPSFGEAGLRPLEALGRIMEDLCSRRYGISLIDDDDPVLYSTTGGNKAVIYISKGMLNALRTDELRAALAHEISHIERSRRPILAVAFILRALSFFNPVVLLEFRRAVREEEKVCDDMAAAMTGSPEALAVTLRLFEPPSGVVSKGIRGMGTALEEYSHGIHIKDRIERLGGTAPREKGVTDPGERGTVDIGSHRYRFEFALILIAVTVINYFIV